MTEPCQQMKSGCRQPRSSFMRGARREGYPIVLTADRTLFADYRILLEGMMSGSQTSVVPLSIMNWIVARPAKADGVHAIQAPLGLRRIEAALHAGGIPESDITIAPPEHLDDVVGPKTRIIGVSSGDPMGIGMSSTTMAGVTGGEIYVSRFFRKLMGKIHHLRQSAPNARVIAGGAGTWQLAQEEQARATLGIDHVMTGYCEDNVGDVFDGILNGGALPSVIAGQCRHGESIRPVYGATSMGAVEISRGCGFGCQFCTLSHEPMRHLPIDTILADVKTNLSAGVKDITLVTEDVFRYGGRGQRAEPKELISLLRALRGLDGLRMIQTDHANIATLAQIRDDELRELRLLMTGERRPDGLVWLNLGVETASGSLLALNGGQGKMGGITEDAWAGVCAEQILRLTRLGYFPLISLVMGLPGETESDVEHTLRWVHELGDIRGAVFPVFHAPLDTRHRGFGIRNMNRLHWRLFRACYRMNFKHMPALFWDNQKRGGVSIPRRLLMQALGYGQVWWWRSLFVLRSGRLL